MVKDYYVYVYMDPRKKSSYFYNKVDFCFLYEPFYVGKGKKGRYLSHLKGRVLSRNSFFHHKLKNMLDLGVKPIVSKVYENLTEKEAYELEKKLITKIGKRIKSEGPLTNLSDGGGGSPMRGKYHHNWGKKFSKETREKISKKLKENNPMRNPEVSEKVRLKNLGRTPWNKGKKETRPEVIKKLSEKKIKYKNIRAICKNSGEVLKFKNTNEVIDFIGKTHRTILNYLISGECKEYFWKYEKN